MTIRHRAAVAGMLLAAALYCGAGTASAAPAPQPGPVAGPAPTAVLGPAPVAPTVPTPSPGLPPDPHYAPPAAKPRPAPPPNGGLAPPATPDTGGGVSIFDIPGQIKAAIASLLASLLAPLIVPLMNALARFLLSTPDVTTEPRVVELWNGLRILACSLYGLFVLAAGILAMSHGTVQQRYAARDLVPRLALGMFAANLSLFFCQQAIALTDAVNRAVFGNGITASDLAGTLVGLLADANTTTAPLYLVVFATVVLSMGLVLLLTLLVRTAVTIVLVVAAPLLLVCHGSPATEGAARMWWRAFGGVLTTQVVQSVAFLVCVKVVLDPGNYGFLGVPTLGSLINLMLLCCTFVLLIKIPSWIRSLVTQPVQRAVGGGRAGGMHLLKKVALGAMGLPFGPYTFGAQLAGRFKARGAAGRGRGPGPGRRRPPGAPGQRGQRPGRPGPGPGGRPPAEPGSGAGPGPGIGPGSPVGTPTYAWGTPHGRPPGPGPGGGPPPGPGPGPGPTGGPGGGAHPGPGRPGPGAASPQYAWGAPRRRGAGNHVPAAAPPRPQLRGSRGGGPAAPSPVGPPPPVHGPQRPGPRPPGPPPPPAANTGRPAPGAPPPPAPRLQPARVPLPPPLPRPVQLRLPLYLPAPAPRSRKTRRGGA